jgi:hypothetical protein
MTIDGETDLPDLHQRARALSAAILVAGLAMEELAEETAKGMRLIIEALRAAEQERISE